jgi:hypothetical protein
MCLMPHAAVVCAHLLPSPPHIASPSAPHPHAHRSTATCLSATTCPPTAPFSNQSQGSCQTCAGTCQWQRCPPIIPAQTASSSLVRGFCVHSQQPCWCQHQWKGVLVCWFGSRFLTRPAHQQTLVLMLTTAAIVSSSWHQSCSSQFQMYQSGVTEGLDSLPCTLSAELWT